MDLLTCVIISVRITSFASPAGAAVFGRESIYLDICSVTLSSGLEEENLEREAFVGRVREIVNVVDVVDFSNLIELFAVLHHIHRYGCLGRSQVPATARMTSAVREIIMISARVFIMLVLNS